MAITRPVDAAPAPQPTPAQPTATDPNAPVIVPTLTKGPAGQTCVAYIPYPGHNDINGLGPMFGTVLNGLLQTYGMCPNAPAPAPAPLNPAVLAEQFWQTIPLPVPKPSIPPGYAITGKPAYLVTDGTLDPPAWTTATPLGALSVVAHGQYSVAWGDGSTSGPFEVEGLAYPHGTISHTYDNVGRVTVTVTETWQATWHLGAAAGTLTQLRTAATIPGFEVQQVQAVLTQ